jgi:alkylation response protein AidB-like acyl-CoA dehydrogenase
VALDLNHDDGDRELALSVGRFCERHLAERRAAIDATGRPLPDIWGGLAEIGVLGLATPEGGGGAASVVAAMEVLGGALAPGPLVATFVATQLVPPAERKAISNGEALVSFGSPPLLPWAAVADVFVELDGDHAWLSRPRGAVEPVATIGGEPWGRARLERVDQLGPAGRALAFGDAALAAYLAGAGDRLLRIAADYAHDRVQFGRSIGEFQAIAHPLANCRMRLDAARVLARLAAHTLDGGDVEGARAAAATARLSAGAAALDTAFRAHQTLGAMGFTAEGPLADSAPRIRQLTLLPPAPDVLREAVLAQLPT